MKVNRNLIAIKAHYFLFMAAMGPILPQLSVYGKEMGISTVVMGAVTGILPVAFLVAKPLFGILVDIYRDYRKVIFMTLIFVMTLSFSLIAFIPATTQLSRSVVSGQLEDFYLDTCKVIESTNASSCANFTRIVNCESECFAHPHTFRISNCGAAHHKLCSTKTNTSLGYLMSSNCDITCKYEVEVDGELYRSVAFWGFLVLMSVGTVGFNVVNSISDAICFDVIGDDHDYGKQRVWGTIGFGLTALVGGYVVDKFSDQKISYIPAVIVMVFCSCLDLVCCVKLKLPVIEPPKNILKDIKQLFGNKRVATFMSYAVLAGIIDGFIIYFLFWYVEDLAAATDVTNIKLLEGLIVAAETLGGEIIFFSVSGKILERIGHVSCFSMCFLAYALRLMFISAVPHPWWILPIEFVFQGPTYALTYTAIVAYANELAPPGASATMQGIAAGMDDGVGYAIGSVLGGVLYKFAGGRIAFQVFGTVALVCGVSHLVIHKTLLKDNDSPPHSVSNGTVYKTPEDAARIAVDHSDRFEK
ncbi:major facilitator superfamily domain-containing protein 6 [Cylas formicarius]|uniref:major facilitator superfamily domain-containing protein 6 n=1 Tax=Cylas formicarius TaxID=197179 RepID=UPI0029583CB6|nr:major facilitator superfamily domain-containing protein 6 [Cylas formicarius]